MLFLVWLVRLLGFLTHSGRKFNSTVPSHKHKQQDARRSRDTDETGNTCQCNVTDWTITGRMENPVPNGALHDICEVKDFPDGYDSHYPPRLTKP